ncbi:hypothetical protein FACS1894125_4750 [Actinomycetota bacterium]|nr:hypothetical protein FACS1894125_4750 [Actinomycetota bacterium]
MNQEMPGADTGAGVERQTNALPEGLSVPENQQKQEQPHQVIQQPPLQPPPLANLNTTNEPQHSGFSPVVPGAPTLLSTVLSSLRGGFTFWGVLLSNKYGLIAKMTEDELEEFTTKELDYKKIKTMEKANAAQEKEQKQLDEKEKLNLNHEEQKPADKKTQTRQMRLDVLQSVVPELDNTAELLLKKSITPESDVQASMVASDSETKTQDSERSDTQISSSSSQQQFEQPVASQQQSLAQLAQHDETPPLIQGDSRDVIQPPVQPPQQTQIVQPPGPQVPAFEPMAQTAPVISRPLQPQTPQRFVTHPPAPEPIASPEPPAAPVVAAPMPKINREKLAQLNELLAKPLDFSNSSDVSSTTAGIVAPVVDTVAGAAALGVGAAVAGVVANAAVNAGVSEDNPTELQNNTAPTQDEAKPEVYIDFESSHTQPQANPQTQEPASQQQTPEQLEPLSQEQHPPMPQANETDINNQTVPLPPSEPEIPPIYIPPTEPGQPVQIITPQPDFDSASKMLDDVEGVKQQPVGRQIISNSQPYVPAPAPHLQDDQLPPIVPLPIHHTKSIPVVQAPIHNTKSIPVVPVVHDLSQNVTPTAIPVTIPQPVAAIPPQPVAAPAPLTFPPQVEPAVAPSLQLYVPAQQPMTFLPQPVQPQPAVSTPEPAPISEPAPAPQPEPQPQTFASQQAPAATQPQQSFDQVTEPIPQLQPITHQMTESIPAQQPAAPVQSPQPEILKQQPPEPQEVSEPEPTPMDTYNNFKSTHIPTVDEMMAELGIEPSPRPTTTPTWDDLGSATKAQEDIRRSMQNDSWRLPVQSTETPARETKAPAAFDDRYGNIATPSSTPLTTDVLNFGPKPVLTNTNLSGKNSLTSELDDLLREIDYKSNQISTRIDVKGSSAKSKLHDDFGASDVDIMFGRGR